jgi:hypothetical protein
LADDEVIGADVTLGPDNGNHLAAARVERIRDPNLKRRTPGSMTLVRRALAKAIWRLGSRGPASAAARGAASSMSLIW